MWRFTAKALICFAFLFPISANASVRLFTDQAKFLAALTGQNPTADFDDLSPGFYGGGGFGPGLINDHGVGVGTINSYLFIQGNTAYGPGNIVTAQQAVPTEVSFTSLGNYNAFGFNIAGGAPITLSFAGETVTLPVNTYPKFSFVGVIVNGSTDYVNLYSTGGGVDFDNVIFATGEVATDTIVNLSGGTPDNPQVITSDVITDVSGHISGQYPEESYVGFNWSGGDLSALGSLTGADPDALFGFYLFATDNADVPIASTFLSGGNAFSDFLNLTLAPGDYSIGFTAYGPTDPDWTIRFVTPVAGTATPEVPELSSWMMLIVGLAATGGAVRRRPIKVAYAI